MLNTPCTAGAVALADTGFGYTLSLIGGKYKMVILFWLGTQPSIRFNELQRRIGGISFKSLTAALRELERDGLVSRTVFPQVPPRVEYSHPPKVSHCAVSSYSCVSPSALFFV